MECSKKKAPLSSFRIRPNGDGGTDVSSGLPSWECDLRKAVLEAERKMRLSLNAANQASQMNGSRLRKSGVRGSGGSRVERRNMESCVW